MGGNEMQKHVFGTYVTLRLGLTFIGALLPIVLYALGAAHGIGLKGSMSEYYWAKSTGGFVPARDCFVGGLFAVAACLYLYKGFSSRENSWSSTFRAGCCSSRCGRSACSPACTGRCRGPGTPLRPLAAQHHMFVSRAQRDQRDLPAPADGSASQYIMGAFGRPTNTCQRSRCRV